MNFIGMIKKTLCILCLGTAMSAISVMATDNDFSKSEIFGQNRTYMGIDRNDHAHS